MGVASLVVASKWICSEDDSVKVYVTVACTLPGKPCKKV